MPGSASSPSATGEPPPYARPSIVEDAQRQQAAALLQHVYRWLDATASVTPGVVLGVVPMLVTAIQLYQSQQYLDCRRHGAAVVGLLQQTRFANPALPPL